MTGLPNRSSIDAVSLLKDLAKNKSQLLMSHPHRGMVMTHDLSLICTENDRAVFKPARNRVSINLGERIYLYSPDSNEVLSAQVCAVDIQLDRLVLGNFVATGRQWFNRRFERVQPHHPIRVNLRCDDCTLSTFLENVSLEGVGLLAYKPAERGLDPRIGNAMKVDFELPIARGRLSLAGRLANISIPGPRLALLGVHSFPTIEQTRILERYITHRKAEIYDEIDEEIQESLEPRSVKELYF